MSLQPLAPAVVRFPAFRCLEGKRLILASASPRRIDIFNRMGLRVDVVPSNFEEDFAKADFASPAAYCAATSRRKGEIVKELTTADATTAAAAAPAMIVSSDTIVVHAGEIFEKPIDRVDAVRMLARFCGRDIEVITAVTIFYRTAAGEYERASFEESAIMHMAEYGQDMIDAVLDTGDGMNHAGALAYQGSALLMVKGITGCHYNLIGFPAPRFYQEMLRIAPLIAPHPGTEQ